MARALSITIDTIDLLNFGHNCRPDDVIFVRATVSKLIIKVANSWQEHTMRS